MTLRLLQNPYGSGGQATGPYGRGMTRLLAVAVILLVTGLVVVAFRSSSSTEEEEGGAVALAEPTADAPPDLGPHRPLRDIDGWLQSDVTSLEELRGKVVVVEFWTFGCINCQRTLPNLIELYAAHSRDDVEFVGIHAPEFDHEADVDNITDAAARLGVTWPIALDTRKRTFHDWQEGTRAYWPRTYVLDPDGHIRFDHIGEGAYDELNDVVARLVANPDL